MRTGLSFCSFLLASLGCAPGFAQSLSFPALEGWWRTDLAHNGQASEMFLHFVSAEGKPTVRLGAPDLGAWDFPFGGVEIAGNQVRLPAAGFVLTFDAPSATLTGTVPEGLVPVYPIAVAFRRIQPPPAPQTPEWNHPVPAISWSFDAGGPMWAGLALDGNMLYAGNDDGAVMAADARTGKLAWLIHTTGSIRAQPTPRGDALYVVSDDGFLYRFDAIRGTERWRVRIDTSTEPRKPRGSRDARFDRYGSAPVLGENVVYVGSRDGHLYALDPETGRQKWRAAAKDMITATALLDEDRVFFGSHDRNVYAVSAANGQALWQHDTRGAVATDMALDGDRLLVGTRAYDLHALNAHTGAPLWNYYYWFSWIDSGPRVEDGTAYVGSSDAASIFAFATRSGELQWRSQLNGWCWPRPAVNGARVYAARVGGDAGFTTRRGALVALDKRTGAVEWAYVSATPDPMKQFGFAASPVATRDRVYAADLDGRLYAFDARPGSERRKPQPKPE
jgi:outer membrane protein assembly factor BamB